MKSFLFIFFTTFSSIVFSHEIKTVIVAFRNAYEGGPDDRTLDGMVAEINWYAEEVIHKVK